MGFDFSKFKLGANSPNTCIGIDISAASIKLVELTKERKSYKVESFAVVPLPQDAVSDKKINDVGLVSAGIRKALAISKARSKHVVCAVSGSSIITKLIQMDESLDESEMETQIALEADQYIPYPLEEVAVDFEIQGPAAEKGMVDVLVVACRREDIDQRVDIMDKAGLKLNVVDLEAYAIERVNTLISKKSGNPMGSVTAVVDIGSAVTTLNVIENGEIIYMREQVFGGRLLTEDIQRRFGLSFEEAEAAQMSGNLPEEYDLEILEPFKMSVVQHVSRALQFFFSSGSHQSIDRLMLSGGVSQLDGLGELLQERLDVTTNILNPFEGLRLGSRVNKRELEKRASSLLIACGLALRGRK